MSSPKKVCVVGAGTAGLVMLKECLQGGLLPTCYDMDSHIGGMWHQKPDIAYSNTPMAWDNLITNTSKNATAFSDFPFPAEQTPYMTREDMLKYFEDYASNFGLNAYISLNTEVVKVCRADNFSSTGQWVVYTRPAISPKTQEDTQIDLTTCKKEIFDAVFICSGFYRRPKYKNIPGKESFQGESLHSYYYKSAQSFEGKTVLVVGNSFSAIDIAEDIANQAKQIILAVGKGTWILPRIAQNGVPFVETFTRENLYAAYGEDSMNQLMAECAMLRLDHVKTKLKPAKPPTEASVSFGEIIQLHILSGKVKIYSRVKSIKGSKVVFNDDSVVDDVDAIIYCTGFSTHVDFVEDGILQQSGFLNLYHTMYPLNIEHNTLAYIGLINADGAYPPVAELQARYAVKITTGELKLPSQSVMKKNTEKWIAMHSKRQGRHILMGPKLSETIAKDLGVQPNFWKIFIRDPTLAQMIWYGPMYSCHYRLIGPGSNWQEARANSYRAYEEKGVCPGVHKTLELLPSKPSTGALVKWGVWGILSALLAKKLIEGLK